MPFCSINAILRNANSVETETLIPLVYAYSQQVNTVKTVEETLQDASQGKTAILNSTEALAVYFSSLFFRLPYDDLKRVSEPLLECCSIHLNPGQSALTEPVLNNIELHIEEPSTFYVLKREAFRLHTDFFTKETLRYLSMSRPDTELE